ncbi:hypothetical protein Tsubulata_009415 [Turnera subulata]|uniref:Phorbol-ester/DAG-type domain-containing protein n=1 Tax=Turnera subulata TaxID=218843 RepID=A0A9Q0J1B9_9ROSI|nr:hypothetical protein Tsubulata_009415 [Turnera subulata]
MVSGSRSSAQRATKKRFTRTTVIHSPPRPANKLKHNTDTSKRVQVGLWGLWFTAAVSNRGGRKVTAAAGGGSSTEKRKEGGSTETYGAKCNACKDLVTTNLAYHCSDEEQSSSSCSFCLHVRCAKISQGVTSPLKHHAHQHDLYCFVATELEIDPCFGAFQCKICRESCKDSMYLCLQSDCRWYSHLGCMSIPDTIKYSGHVHGLTLRDSSVPVVEEEHGGSSTEEHCCNVCSKRRDPIYPVYHCKECPEDCPYFAHIECVASQFPEAPPASEMVSKVSGVEVNEKYSKPRVKGASMYSGFASNETKEPKYSICSECGDIFHGSSSLCTVCTSNPDSGRALAIDNNIQKETYHFIHNHTLSYFNLQEETVLSCNACRSRISSHGYGCLKCSFFVHQSCMEIPRELDHPYHPLHPLRADVVETDAEAFSRSSDEMDQEANKHPDVGDTGAVILKPRCKRNTNNKDFSNDHVLTLHDDDSKLMPTSCDVCHKLVKPPYYTCGSCKFPKFHKICAELPLEMKYPLHSEHPLIYYPIDYRVSFAEALPSLVTPTEAGSLATASTVVTSILAPVVSSEGSPLHPNSGCKGREEGSVRGCHKAQAGPVTSQAGAQQIDPDRSSYSSVKMAAMGTAHGHLQRQPSKVDLDGGGSTRTLLPPLRRAGLLTMTSFTAASRERDPSLYDFGGRFLLPSSGDKQRM